MKSAKVPLAATMISITVLVLITIMFFSIDSELGKITAEAVRDDLDYGFGNSDFPIEVNDSLNDSEEEDGS